MTNNYSVTNLVSNNPDNNPQLLDPYVSLGWGIAIRPAGLGGHFWVSNSGTGISTEYVGDVGGVPIYQDDLKIVEVTPSEGNIFGISGVSGQVFNGSSDFVITQDHPNGEITAPSKFIFVATDGGISGWTERQNEDGSFDRPLESEVVVNKFLDSIYYGVAITDFETDNRLYAADFGFTPDIEVYDGEFNEVTEQFDFLNPFAADGYAEYNIQLIDDSLFVAYAQPDPEVPGNEVIEPGLGRIAEFDLEGNLINIWDDGGLLNAPWGFVVAPDDFGEFSNALLVSNFGDGTIVAFDRDTREPIDYLRGDDGEPIEIDGLWGLVFGNGASLGESNDLYFAAGNDLGDNAGDGVFGKVEFTPDIDSIPEGGDETITGTPEDDLLTVGGDNNIITTDGGNDVITALGDNQFVEAGDGNNIISIGSGEVTTGDGNNFIAANNDSATVNTGAGNDTVNLARGNLVADAGEGDNHFTSGAGDDEIMAGLGNDTVHAGAGNNIIDVGEGDNLINSVVNEANFLLSVGNNTIITGSGADTFEIAPGEGIATITNFDSSDRFILKGFKPDFSGAIDFSDLTIVQEGADTVIQLTGTDDVLAVLQNTDASIVNESNFGGLNIAEIAEIESNDTLDTATFLGAINANNSAVVTGELAFDFDNNPGIDDTEDVDLYGFELNAGDTVAIDLDEVGDFSFLAELILFDAEGNNVAQGTFFNPGTDDTFTSFLPYIEYTAETDGTYYVGVSSTFNAFYDPNTAGSGSGDAFREFGFDIGSYELEVNLVENNIIDIEPPLFPDVLPPEDAPVVSLNTITGTYGLDETLISQELVESVDDISPEEGTGGSVITLVLSTEGDIPPEGIPVFIDSDVDLSEYVFPFEPFFRGAEVLDPVIDENGNPTGIYLNLTANNAVINLTLQDKPETETDGAESATFTVGQTPFFNLNPDASSSTVTFYDSVETAPAPAVEPVVSLEIADGELVESEGNTATFTFTLSEPPPEEGVVVYVNTETTSQTEFGEGETFQGLGQFDIFNAEVTGGAFPSSNFSSSGFYFKITEQTATIEAAAFPDEAIEGVQEFNFFIESSIGYQIDDAANSGIVTVADTAESQPILSLTTSPEVLVESEGTVSVHNFNLSTTPPEGGIYVTVTAEGVEEFDLDAIATTGITGEIDILESFPLQLGFTITEANASISLPVLNDGEAESLETATFTLNPGEGYEISPLANEGTFQIVDTPEQTPPPAVETEFNNTIETAINVTPTFGKTTNIDGAIDYNFLTADPEAPLYDDTEDVDMYSIDLEAGQTANINAVASDLGTDGLSTLFTVLRVFDESGNELAASEQVATPDDLVPGEGDSYLEFTPDAAGTYYVGISNIGNNDYDPNVGATGSSWRIQGVAEPGAYQLSFELSDSNEGKAFEPVFGSINGDTLEVEGTNQLIFAGDLNDLIDTSTGDSGNRIYAGSGDDTLILGEGDRILAGDGDDAIFATSGGNNTITGGAGADQFWIASAEIPDAANIITDFTSGEDVIGIAGLGIGFDDLSVTDLEGDALIAGSGSDLAILQGIDATNLTTSDFAFA
ncbi:MAG: TIGR03118 family protein [Cyanobacteria bacterium P01_G01_bin.19]